MAYAIITREAMASEFNGVLRKSAKYLPSGTATAIENGSVVVLGSLISGEREVYTATTPTATTALSAIAIVTTPEVMVDERKKNLDEFINEAGDVITVDKLSSGDIFSLTADGFDGTPTVGYVVELTAGTKLSAVATLTAGSTQVGTIIDLANDKYAVQVI
ncbi:MAG: hypothetical protein K0R54_4795 [Clostridiaceae bacterium]|jgi:hypothetical protein|nr:hypothetical protein [Clostridiaceae bacterium]